jgi:hypothetical protein
MCRSEPEKRQRGKMDWAALIRDVSKSEKTAKCGD